jgi:biopolymer transport protein ExbD
MAGGGGGEANSDNPLPLNVVPLIDVIFCLLLFFMCSFHFKTLEGKMDAWLPQDKGNVKSKPDPTEVGEIRIFLNYDPATRKTIRRFVRTEYPDDTALGNVMAEQAASAKANGKGEIPVVIQVDKDVRWKEVVRVMDIARMHKLQKLEFSFAPTEFVIPDVLQQANY